MTILADALSIEKGHEIWVEHDGTDIREGNTVALRLGFGHQMCHEKALDPAKVGVVVVGPEERFTCRTEPQATYLAAFFQPESRGWYTVLAEYDLGVSDLHHDPGAKYYIQYTQTVIPVSGASNGYALRHEQPLEILPTSCKTFSKGDKVEFNVSYEGKPLSGKGEVVSAACNRIEAPFDLTPDPAGNFVFELVSGGNWKFMVRYKDREKGVPGLFSAKAITATYTIIGVSDEEQEEIK